MDDILVFAMWIGAVSTVLYLAALSNRITERFSVPAPAIFLVAAALASQAFPGLRPQSITVIQEIVTVALIVILFNGGMGIGWNAFRRNAGAIVWVGVMGTLVTAAALAAAAHFLFDFDWRLALLLGTALSPTDPAVVFSVLGRQEISGRSGTLLEGESGANDPVGIALMVALIATGSASGPAAVWAGTEEFLLQMGVGAAVGYIGGQALRLVMRRVALSTESLYSVQVIAAVGVIYGLASLLHGSGFLAVLFAGILVGDERAPYKREVESVFAAFASLGEIVAFTVLGLTVDLGSFPDGDAWLIGLALAVLMAFVVRPVLVGLVLWPVALARNERWFVLWAGLKGAVPILLGTYILASDDGNRVKAYDIVFVVVLFSVVVQGGLVPWLSRRLNLPVHVSQPEPWSLGMRFRDEPTNLYRHRVAAGSAADGASLEDLPLGDNVWVSLVGREGAVIHPRGGTRLQAGDEVLLLGEHDDVESVRSLLMRAPDSPSPAGADETGAPLPGAAH